MFIKTLSKKKQNLIFYLILTILYTPITKIKKTYAKKEMFW